MVGNSLKLANINIKDDQHVDIEDYGSDTDTASENSEMPCKHNKENEMTLDAVEYLAGWLAKKYRSKIPEIGCTTTEFNKSTCCHDYAIPSWINHLSYGGLIIPSNDLKKIIFRVETLFNKFTKNQIPKGSGVVKKFK